MINSKLYLNVPYAEKDAAKALGAKWDPANKQWYAPANQDMTLFAKWQTDSTSSVSSTKKQKSSTSASNIVLGVTTHAQDKNFVAYNGDEPPWD